MEGILKDILFSFRSLKKQLRTTIVILLTLGISIGAVTVLFTIVNSILLRPLNYADSERLVRVLESNPEKDSEFFSVSPSNYLDWKKQTHSFKDMGAMTRPDNLNLVIESEPEPVAVSRVSVNLFSLLGVNPILGRSFLLEDGKPNSENAVLLGYDFWRNRFGSDKNVIGRQILLNRESHTVLGILPADFRLPLYNEADLYVPLKFASLELGRGRRFLRVVARLKPDVTMERAQSDVNTVAGWLEREYPESNRGWGIRLKGLKEVVIGEDFRKSIVLLLSAVLLVLLISIANVANLLSAQSSARHQEIALRAALGATRFRLIRQLITESILLSVMGGTIGVFLAFWGLDLLLAYAPYHFPRVKEIRLDGFVLFVTLLVSFITAILFGIVPALQSSKVDVNTALKEASKGTIGVGRGRVRNVLVVAEVILALSVVIAASLLMKSFWRLENVNPGFDPHQVVSLSLNLPETTYSQPESIDGFYNQLLDRVKGLPGVQSAAFTNILPLGGGNSMTAFHIVGRPSELPSHSEAASYRIVSPQYFSAIRMRIMEGRYFQENEHRTDPAVVIINHAMRRRYWSDESPLGKRIEVPLGDSLGTYEIIGVVENVKEISLEEEELPTMYFSSLQVPPQRSSTLVVRTTGDPLNSIASIRQQLWSLDKNLTAANVETLEQVLAHSLADRRFSMILFAIFAFIAILFSAVGIYSLMAFSVNQRMQEMGIRMALGAQRKDLLRMLLKHGMGLVTIGLVLGLALSFACSRIISSLLYEMSPADPFIFLIGSLFVCIVSLVASLIPTWKAANVSPLRALRYE